MKAVVCRSYGPPEVLRLEEVEEPTPKPGEVRIRVWASAVTSSDCYVRGLNLPFRYRALARLALGLTGPRRPILGMVLAGEVDTLGPGVTSFQMGDQVIGLDRHRFGTYAEEVCWPQATVLALRPAWLSWEETAALPYGGLLALHFLRKAGPRKRPASARLRRFGRRRDICGPAGPGFRGAGDRRLQHRQRRAGQVPRGIGGGRLQDRGLHGPGRALRRHLRCRREAQDSAALRNAHRALALGGRVVSVDDGTPRLLAADLVLLVQLAGAGEIKPVVDRCYALEDIVEAHRYVDQGHKRGNVVVTVASQKPRRSS